jgi:hypothetical protein
MISKIGRSEACTPVKGGRLQNEVKSFADVFLETCRKKHINVTDLLRKHEEFRYEENMSLWEGIRRG